MSKQRKKTSGGALIVDGIPLRWKLRSQPQKGTAEGDIGLRLEVGTEDAAHRLLILEYPFEQHRPGTRVPERASTAPASLAHDIRLAMAHGWQPKSRGRPFIFALYDET